MWRFRQGFTFFEMAIVLMLVIIVGMIAIPGVLMEVRERDEVRALALLERIARAEHHRRHKSPAGVYGYLEDLVAEGLLDEDDLAAGAGAGSLLRLGGYYFAVLLPDAEGLPVAASEAARADPERSGKSFLAVAWPVRAGETGYGTYAVDESLLLWQASDRDPKRSGPRIPDLAGHLLDRPAGAPLPDPWVPLLRSVTALRMLKAVEVLGLPVPPALQEAADLPRE